MNKRVKYKLMICVICGDEISYYTNSDRIMSPDAHSNKKTCGNPACLTELKSTNAQMHEKKFKVKKCKQCPYNIPFTWPGGANKSKPDYDEQIFCSNKCKADWQHSNSWYPAMSVTKSSILCQALRQSREYQSDSIENFIYGGVI